VPETASPTPTETASPTPTATPTPTPTPPQKDPVTEISVPERQITADGSVSEVADSTPAVTYENDFVVVGGEPSFDGARFWFGWSADHFALSAEVQDDKHVQARPTGSHWEQDCLQYAIAPGNSSDVETWDGFDLVYHTEREETVFVHRKHSLRPAKEMDNTEVDFPATVSRNEDAGTTTYECAIPWSELEATMDDDPIAVDLALIDADSDSDRGEHLAQWGHENGIFYGKNVTNLKTATLD
jgi:hypothetical protein